MNRRDFIKKSSSALVSAAIAASTLSSKCYARILGANDRLNFAILGIRNRGYALLDGIQGNKNTLVTHICDVYFGKAWYTNTRGPIGIGKEVPVPDYLNWDLWQGPVPRRAYKDNIHP